MKYKTIQAESLEQFDKLCNDHSEKGWSPMFAMTVTHIRGDDPKVLYTQQWTGDSTDSE